MSARAGIAAACLVLAWSAGCAAPALAAVESCRPPKTSPAPGIEWAGKNVLWLGTSIPHQGRGRDGYPEQFCKLMNCRVTNNAFSGSHIRWFEHGVDESCTRGRNAPKGLSATTRELREKIAAAMPDDGRSSYNDSCNRATRPITMSYEERINAPWASTRFDIVVIDHGHNDREPGRSGDALDLGKLDQDAIRIDAVTKGKVTEIRLPAGHGLSANDDITIRTPGIARLDFWTGEVALAGRGSITIGFDSSALAGDLAGGGSLVRYDKSKLLDAYNLVISDIRHMNAFYGGPRTTIVLMTPPTEWTAGGNDGSIARTNVAICELAAKWNLSFYNMTAELGVGRDDLRFVLPDGVHPTTPESRQYIAQHVAAWASGGRVPKPRKYWQTGSQ